MKLYIIIIKAIAELRNRVEIEVAVLGSQSRISLVASVDVKQNEATASREPVWPSVKALGW